MEPPHAILRIPDTKERSSEDHVSSFYVVAVYLFSNLLSYKRDRVFDTPMTCFTHPVSSAIPV